MIDTHCHLNKDYYEDIDKVLKENQKVGVTKIIISATNKNEFAETLEIISKYQDVFASLGIHPEYANTYKEKDLDLLKKLLKTKKVVAVGEIGLDYHYNKDNKENQKKLFQKQLEIAQDLSLPVVIHTRDAINDTVNILKKYKLKGVIHCFSGSYETANLYLKLGLKLGIGGVITFKNSNLKETLQKIDLDNIVLETDSPYLTPEPNRGKQNSSKNLIYIVKTISNIKNLKTTEVVSKTTKNASDLFDLL